MKTGQRDALTSSLQEALAREKALIQEKHDLSRRRAMLTREFEHRLVNGLQWIISLLSLQNSAATTPEAARQLIVAARRVEALGRVHCKGLGMKIVLSLVKQIGGELHILPGENGRSAPLCDNFRRSRRADLSRRTCGARV